MDFKDIPSNERAAATLFKTVVLDLGAALELRPERGAVLCVLFLMGCVDLRINDHQQVLFLEMLHTCLYAFQQLFSTWQL